MEVSPKELVKGPFSRWLGGGQAETYRDYQRNDLAVWGNLGMHRGGSAIRVDAEGMVTRLSQDLVCFYQLLAHWE